MKDNSTRLRSARYALWVFALVTLSIFVVEGAIMLAIPALPAWFETPGVKALADAGVLVLVTAPVLWWLAVVPLRRLAEGRGDLLERLFRAQEDERARIARDLHDEIGQQLTALLVGLKTIDTAPDLEAARARAGNLRALGATAHEEVRRLARGLHAGVLQELGLATAVESLCAEFERAHGTAVRVCVWPQACEGLNATAETAIYRILQEALAKAARHAHATEIDVVLRRQGHWVTLSVLDNGRGFGVRQPATITARGNSLGLDSMRERATMLGGQCRLDSQIGRGTTLQVTIPVQGNDHDPDPRVPSRRPHAAS